jgi:uncharacterized membrane protein YhhN
MNAAPVAFGVAAAAFAVGDWWAVGRGRPRLEYVCKPAATAALLATAATLGGVNGAAQGCFVVALALCLVGDVCLMLPERASGQDRFIPGLVSFFLAHVAFTIGFVEEGVTGVGLAVGAALVVLVAGPLAVRFVRALRRAGRRDLVGPVLAYLVAIGATATTAVGTGDGWAIAGAWLFVASDALIAETRFVGARRGIPVAIMVTYYLALAGIVASLH